MDSRLKDLAGKLDAGLIAVVSFFATPPSSRAARGQPQNSKGMAGAQSGPSSGMALQSFVTSGNDVLEAGAELGQERKVTMSRRATFGDREQSSSRPSGPTAPCSPR
jgi:hypothetical protein